MGWIGLAWIVGSICVSFLCIAVGIILAEQFGRKNAVLWIIGLQCAFQMFISFTSAEFVKLELGGVAFLTIAGSLVYPTIELAANYLNEFYGLAISRTSVNAQMISRILTSLLLLFTFILPTPSGFSANHHNYVTLNSIVPRISVASIIATWITGLVMVYVFDLIKARTGDRWLWMRSVSSSVVSMAVNSVLFVLIAFIGVVSWGEIASMIGIQIVFKFVDSFLELGFLYGMKGYKRHQIASGRAPREPLIIVPLLDADRLGQVPGGAGVPVAAAMPAPVVAVAEGPPLE